VSVLVIDVGTSSVRAGVVRPDATVEHVHVRPMTLSTPAAGLVEFDAAALAADAVEVAGRTLADGGPVQAVGIANQRASTVVWERVTGRPVAPAIGWQDLRTVGECLTFQGQGLRLSPNASATKLAHLLEAHDPHRSRDLCFGTVDTWIAWVLSQGAAHVTDPTNAGATGLLRADGSGWAHSTLETLNIAPAMLPSIVDSSGVLGEATLLDGAPPIAGLAGDQQASLVGQGCTSAGLAKVTFGTGAMLDVCTGSDRPQFELRGTAGCLPVIAWRRDGRTSWGAEAIMLSAGTNVEWLRDDLGLLSSAEQSDEVAASCADSGGVFYVPALHGMGTPSWDFGARGALLGITRGVGRPHIVRAVLEGIAHRGADLVEAAETDTGLALAALRVDGGMTANATFLQALANAIARPIEVSPELEATTLGAGYLAGMAIGLWRDEQEVADTWSPRNVVEPNAPSRREQWLDARGRALRWEPGLSALDF
jgi:glycerol kinase